ncbi:MAG: hypothetical protein OXE94_10310 [Aestuariivita sp.]|nr:hypothetical protein [Aestuariivita sp.]MCY4201331.1 hypothetical protein [Aestuariivita sp.]MCY4287984.1 hypothetical protein [Aestuariivita sp.]MCY4347929.1 hypothetical protein [Aestuariivita sp.]
MRRPPTLLLRESYREDGKVKKRRLANLTALPPDVIAGLRLLLKGGTAISDFKSAFTIVRSLPHGHVAAILGTLKQLNLDKFIDRKPSEQRNRVIAMITARLIAPTAKLATMRDLVSETAATTLGQELALAISMRMICMRRWIGWPSGRPASNKN